MSSPQFNPIPFTYLSKRRGENFRRLPGDEPGLAGAVRTVKSAARPALYAVRYLAVCIVLLLALPVQAGDQPASANEVASATWKLAKTDPAELVRRTSRKEVANSFPHRPPMRYRLRKVTATSDTTKEIVETRQGGVARLLAVGGHPLSPLRARREIQRLHTLAADPSKQAHRRGKELRDARRVQRFTRLLPAAFLYRFAGSVASPTGPLIRLTFTPNPAFTPPNFEARVMTGIRGEVWIDPQDSRIVRLEGHFFRNVDFGWGILGSLYPGGTMQLEQTKTQDCGWQLTRLSLHLDGKELLFKSLHISIEETASDYRVVPTTWSYKDAIRWLLRMPD